MGSRGLGLSKKALMTMLGVGSGESRVPVLLLHLKRGCSPDCMATSGRRRLVVCNPLLLAGTA